MTIEAKEWERFISLQSEHEMTIHFLFPELTEEEKEKVDIVAIYQRIHELKTGGLKNDF